MKKISVIYWSNGGNVEVLANAISESINKNGVEVLIKHVTDAKVEDVINADAVAFGSPSMDNNRIEQYEMAPFVKQFKLLPVENKKIVLFGSYGWDNGQFMNEWINTMKDYGFNVIGSLAIKESPTKEDLDKAKELGKLLTK